MADDSRTIAPAGPAEQQGAPRLLPALLLLFLGSIWGLNASIAKLAGQSGVAPIGFTSWQMSGAAVVVTAVCLARGLRIRFDAAHWRYYLLVGVLGTGAPSVNLVNALNHLPAGVLTIGLAMVPLFSYLMSLTVGLERFDRLRAGGILLGFAGMLLIILPEASLPNEGDALWFLISLLTPLLYAFSSVAAAKFRPQGASSLPLAGGMLITLGIVLWPTAWAAGQIFTPSLGETGGLSVASVTVLVAIAVSSVAYFIYFEIVRMAGPVAVSVVGYIVTCTGIGWGMLFFGEEHSLYVWAAVAVIFAGLALVNKRQEKAAILKK
ncbi:MAG: DMT family transporter [Marivibrio sp.]|uniref:DMT family transporter n=1 Tax=Marivibrio sp. TaxID=2039719 RepID=UPI0032ED148F